MRRPNVRIHDSVFPAIKAFRLPKEIGFGTVMAPVMASCIYENNAWGNLEILPYGPIQVAPCTKALHYAQEIFEGLKAYHVAKQGLFSLEPKKTFFASIAPRIGLRCRLYLKNIS